MFPSPNPKQISNGKVDMFNSENLYMRTSILTILQKKIMDPFTACKITYPIYMDACTEQDKFDAHITNIRPISSKKQNTCIAV